MRLVLPGRFRRMPDFDADPPLDSGQKEAGRRLRLLRRIMSEEEEDEGVVVGLAGVGWVVVGGGWWTGLLLVGWFTLVGENRWVSEWRREGGEVAGAWAGGRG